VAKKAASSPPPAVPPPYQSQRPAVWFNGSDGIVANAACGRSPEKLQRVGPRRQRDLRLGLSGSEVQVIEIVEDMLIERGSGASATRW